MAFTKRQLIELLEGVKEDETIKLALLHDAEEGDLLEPVRISPDATIEEVVVDIADPYHSCENNKC